MKAALAIILLAVITACGQPAQVILLRHAEKPASAEAVDLSPRGQKRAQALVSLLGRGSPLTSNAPVAALFATRVTRDNHSHRTGETLEPLARDLGLPILKPFGSGDCEGMAAKVLEDRAYQGKTVIICWTHHDLAELAGAFGVKPQPPAWKESVFDRLWRITFTAGHAQLVSLPQHLLKGDATH